MRRFRWISKVVAVCIFGFALAGCASGPKYSEMETTIPNLPANMGRIYIYRSTTIGLAVQPDVKVNGEVVGRAEPDGFLYVDDPAGDYTITTSTEVSRSLTLALKSGETRYVKLDIGVGFFVAHVYPELVDNSTGEKDIASLHYMGQ